MSSLSRPVAFLALLAGFFLPAYGAVTVPVCTGTFSASLNGSLESFHRCSVQWTFVDVASLVDTDVVAYCTNGSRSMDTRMVCRNVTANVAVASAAQVGALDSDHAFLACANGVTGGNSLASGVYAPTCGVTTPFLIVGWDWRHAFASHPDWYGLSEGGSSEGGAMGFWPEMTMENAMELFSAICVTWLLAWGLNLVIRRVLLNK